MRIHAKCLGKCLVSGDLVVKNLPATVGDSSSIPGSGIVLEEEMATHSSILAGKSHGQRSQKSTGTFTIWYAPLLWIIPSHQPHLKMAQFPNKPIPEGSCHKFKPASLCTASLSILVYTLLEELPLIFREGYFKKKKKRRRRTCN